MNIKDFENWTMERELTKEEFEFYEDFLVQGDFLNKEEVVLTTEEGLCLDNKGNVGFVESEMTKYIQSRNNQKRNFYIKNKRKQNIKLV